ncbi:MAG TPA: DUF6084 family protein [Verrucomicrobiae bacterium]|nr:DUF6084 family protein [Verrucomicrobiae bacterium]
MSNLNFSIGGLEVATRALTPLMQFTVNIQTVPEDRQIEAVLLAAQIQLQCPQRRYAPAEKQRLLELFGPPEQWGQTLRNRLWAHANTTVGSFCGMTKAMLTVPCSYDLTIASTKYLYALEAGEVSLLFLFSGSVFYLNTEGRLQVERISWSKEAVYRFPIKAWQDLMEAHYPNSAWVGLRRDVFNELDEYKRRHGLATWETVIQSLLSLEDPRKLNSASSATCPSRPAPRPEEVPA